MTFHPKYYLDRAIELEAMANDTSEPLVRPVIWNSREASATWRMWRAFQKRMRSSKETPRVWWAHILALTRLSENGERPPSFQPRQD